jgi:hypothetical protein
MKMKKEEPSNFDFGILELYWKNKIKRNYKVAMQNSKLNKT